MPIPLERYLSNVFPMPLNNLECSLVEDYTGGTDLVVRPEDIAKFGVTASNPDPTPYYTISALAPNSAYPSDSFTRGTLLTLIHPAALDAYGRLKKDTSGNLLDPAKVKIVTVIGVYLAARSPAGKNSLRMDDSIPGTFPAGSYLRCEVTAELLESIGHNLTLALYAKFQGLIGTTLADADVEAGGQPRLYFSPDHPDGAGQPQLVRKDVNGVVTVIG
jgi:hypothetical protein